MAVRHGGNGLALLARAALWAGAVLCAGACADATAPFQPADRIDESQLLPRQLTFASADDRSPVWSTDGTRVLYATEGASPFPLAPGLLLEVPSGGGGARAALPSLQFPGSAGGWFASPVPSPVDDRLAWVELWGVRPPNLCPGTTVACTPEGGSDGVAPRLSELRVRVRIPGQGPPEADPRVRVAVEGVTPVEAPGGLTRFRVENHPFQRLFQVEGSAVFRPSWSPDGSRLAFSDGLRLLVWAPGAGDPVPVPGTDDGVHAAWSPDGQWLAYTELVRGTPEDYECQHFTPLGPVCEQERTEVPILERRVVVIRPDGSDRSVVGPGDDPAWAGSSDRLVVRRNGSLWLVDRNGSGAAPIPGTEGGREPAVSPDGATLALARLDASLTRHDVWLMPVGGVP